MKLVERFWTAVSYLGSILTLSPFHDASLSQTTLSNKLDVVDFSVPWPRFYPPTGPPDGFPGDDFFCDYPAMEGWRTCARDSKQCWIWNPDTNEEYNITTNYEDHAPKGINRYYELDLVDGHWDADGINFKDAKMYNGSYPGPWLQACWGDTVEVKVNNHLRYNGTSTHWHGIRMNQTMHMDGVNGVSQCPTAPGDSFTYKFHVTQYGSSWYHSHYSLQYADGAAGPITFHGPTVDDFDEAKKPFLMTDWYHASAFWAATQSDDDLVNRTTRPTTLINGRGDCRRWGWQNETEVWQTYNITFERKPDFKKPKRYLLRLENVSFDTTFVFSIDHHLLQVVSIDFVPIHSYKATSILVGIGQRYHVIVDADPIAYGDNVLPADGNYWIRNYVAQCFRYGRRYRPPGYERVGIVRYDPTSKTDPQTDFWRDVSLDCSDEPPSRLKPILPWKVGKPSNTGEHGWGEEFDILGLGSVDDPPAELPYPMAYFSLGDMKHWNPMRVDYNHPIFLDLDKNDKKWPDEWAVTPEDYGPDDWVYLVVDGTSANSSYGAHPIHLHGHDFALLQTETGVTWHDGVFKPNLNNPPRRDVVLVPTSGFVVVAFKTDNPGSWLLHCHIATHIGEGLGFQIMERQEDASAMWPPDSSAMIEVRKGCERWDKWYSNRDHWFNATLFQDDSGI